MAKTYLATKQEVQTVSNDVTTINSQINTPSTGLEARVQATEAFGTRITTSEADIDTLEDQMNNPTTGIVKQLLDIDNDINEADVGIKARITDLEQGGTSVTKFRAHSPSGKYEDGEVVQKDKVLYKANSAIDGSSTSVPFVVGAGANSWTPLDQKDPSTPLVFQTNSAGALGALTVMSPSSDGVFIQSLSNNVSGNSIGFQVDTDRGRVAYMTNGVQATLESDDMLRVSDADELYTKKEKTDGFTYDATAKRHTQVTAPTTTAATDTDLLTKKDGDALYGRSGSVTVSGYLLNDSTQYRTVCETESFRFEITMAEGRLVSKNGVSTRVVWFRVGQNDANGSFSTTGNGSITPLNVLGQQHYTLAVNGEQAGIINVVYRRFSEASLQCFVTMNLS